MNKALNPNKINPHFRSWRVAYARVVGEKNTNNGWLRLLPKWNTNKGEKIHSDFCSWRVADAHVVGGKNTNNGGLRLVPKLNTNKGTEGSSTADAYVKNAFKGLFTKQLQPINGVVNSELFNIIWNNVGTANNGLRQSLFGNRLEAASLIYFKNTLVQDINSSLYDFINLK